jgi:protein-disulfide isomerase
MYKLFLTTATVALFSMTACDSASKEKTSADSKVESKKDASSEEAKTKDSKVDAKTDSKPTALPTSLDTPDELKPEKVEKFGDKEIADIERVIFNMLKRDPQKFMEIVQMAGQFQQAKQDLEVRQLLEANKDKLLKEDNAIVTGNTKGTVNFILIEDPLCPNCRTLDGILGNVMKKQPSLKVIKHQWAFLEGGEPSSFVARHFQAAYKSDKTKFHSLQKAFLMLQETPTE